MHKGYGQFCPLAKASELLCERWTLIVIREFVAGSRKFNDLRRGLPLMAPTLLSRRLKQLVDAGVIRKVIENGGPAYALTVAGMELESLVNVMAVWGHRWARSQFEDHDLDVGLLMWDIRRGVDILSFPIERTVIEFDFTDAPDGMERWWLISEAGDIDLCLETTGFEVDLIVKSLIRALTAVWMCAQSFQNAIKTGELSIFGPTNLRKQLSQWLPGSPLARMGAESRMTNPITEKSS